MRIMLLNDGETYTDVEGCKICEVPDDIQSDDVKSYVRENPECVKAYFQSHHMVTPTKNQQGIIETRF